MFILIQYCRRLLLQYNPPAVGKGGVGGCYVQEDHRHRLVADLTANNWYLPLKTAPNYRWSARPNSGGLGPHPFDACRRLHDPSGGTARVLFPIRIAKRSDPGALLWVNPRTRGVQDDSG